MISSRVKAFLLNERGGGNAGMGESGLGGRRAENEKIKKKKRYS